MTGAAAPLVLLEVASAAKVQLDQGIAAHMILSEQL